MPKLRFLIVASAAPILLGLALRTYSGADDASNSIFTTRFLVWSLLVSVMVAFSGVFSRLLHCMLPKKRPGDGVVVEVEVGGDTGSSAPLSSINKHRIGNFVAESTVSNNSSLASSNHGSVVEKDVPIMALGHSNQSDIDEDLHSRQLAVYGRETMRRLFASNVLISGIQGLGAEIGTEFGNPHIYRFQLVC